MSGSIKQIQASLFGTANYVCGGHGARWPIDAKFTVPAGITVYFFVDDGASLGNSIGQKVEQVLTGGVAPPPKETVTGGSPCWNYRLFHPKYGGYLNLAMSSAANPHYISTTSTSPGLSLEDILKRIANESPIAHVYWSACRALEQGTEVYALEPPNQALTSKNAKLRALASKAGKSPVFTV